MSDTATRRRLRAQASVSDPLVMTFLLDAPVQPGVQVSYDSPGDPAPLPTALFAIDGIKTVQVAGSAIHMRRDDRADWAALKPAIAAAIRQVLDQTDSPLGDAAQDAGSDAGSDAALMRQVEDILAHQVNPSIAAHGGHIAVEKVEDGTAYLRMSGGCQGCAASSATLQQGVERALRAGLPALRNIVDMTDHDAGQTPFYAREAGQTPALIRPVPPGVIDWQDGQLVVDPDYIAPRLNLTPDSLRKALQSGAVVGVTETGSGADAGKTRVILRAPQRAWAAEVLPDGSAREIPPPRATTGAAGQEKALADRLRHALSDRAPEDGPITYGGLARSLGYWAPGSLRKITAALETTMREDAEAGRPFIAARAVGRGRDMLPGKGFFDRARALSRGPADGETAADFHAAECRRLDAVLAADDATRDAQQH